MGEGTDATDSALWKVQPGLERRIVEKLQLNGYAPNMPKDEDLQHLLPQEARDKIVAMPTVSVKFAGYACLVLGFGMGASLPALVHTASRDWLWAFPASWLAVYLARRIYLDSREKQAVKRWVEPS